MKWETQWCTVNSWRWLCVSFHSQLRYSLSLVIFQAGSVLARDLTQEELELAGIYVHCPYNAPYACEGVREVVRTVYTKVGYGDVAQNLLRQLEILTLLAVTENGNPTATFSSPEKGFVNDLLWGAKDGKIALIQQSTKSVSTFRVEPGQLVGSEGLYVRAFSEAEFSELHTDY